MTENVSPNRKSAWGENGKDEILTFNDPNLNLEIPALANKITLDDGKNIYRNVRPIIKAIR